MSQPSATWIKYKDINYNSVGNGINNNVLNVNNIRIRCRTTTANANNAVGITVARISDRVF